MKLKASTVNITVLA